MNDLPLLILFLLTIAFLFRIDFIYYIVYVCIGVYAFSQFVTPRALNKVKIGREFHDHAFLGESIQVKLILSNQGRLPIPWIQVTESVPIAIKSGPAAKKALSLGGKKHRELDYCVQAMKRGYYRIGPLLITTGDVFGFRENKARLPADYLTVYPRIIPLFQLGLPSRLPFGTISSRQRLFEDPARPMGVREYVSGDSLRHINWKVSAHNRDLLVKTFQPAISLETAILVNLNSVEYQSRYRYDGPEWAVVVAASLASHLIKQRQAVGLAINGADPLKQESESRGSGLELLFDEESGRLKMEQNQNGDEIASQKAGPAVSMVPAPISPRPGRAHLMKVLETLARIEAAHTYPFQTWIPRACLHLSWGVTILVISPNGDEAICQSLHKLVKAGYNPVLIVIEPYANFRNIKERARGLGFPAFHVAGDRDLDTWRVPQSVV